MQVLLESPELTIWHDANQRMLHLTWRGVQDEQLVMAYLAVVLYQVRATGSTSILSDSTLDSNGWGRLVHWMAQDYFQKLADNGINAIAWVVSNNPEARADMNEVLIHATRPVTDSFGDTEAAYSWLRTQA